MSVQTSQRSPQARVKSSSGTRPSRLYTITDESPPPDALRASPSLYNVSCRGSVSDRGDFSASSALDDGPGGGGFNPMGSPIVTRRTVSRPGTGTQRRLNQSPPRVCVIVNPSSLPQMRSSKSHSGGTLVPKLWSSVTSSAFGSTSGSSKRGGRRGRGDVDTIPDGDDGMLLTPSPAHSRGQTGATVIPVTVYDSVFDTVSMLMGTATIDGGGSRRGQTVGDADILTASFLSPTNLGMRHSTSAVFPRAQRDILKPGPTPDEVGDIAQVALETRPGCPRPQLV